MNSPDMNALHNDHASHVTRRRFCNNLLLTTGVVLVAPAAVGNIAAGQESTIAYPPKKIDGADTLLPGASLYFDYPTRNDPAVLVRSAEGEYRAYSRKCSHAGCSVEVDAPRHCLSCPCHRGAYDMRNGYVMFGPPRRPLDGIVLQVRAGGQVWAVGKSLGRNAELITQEVRKT
jgi:Rieske Fe-S protein